MIVLVLGVFLFSLSGVFAEACDLQVSLVNQDPYPAIQGEEAKLVFQIDGLANAECGTVNFELLEKYPITLDPSQQGMYTIESGIFEKDYKSFFLAPFKIRVSEDALDGDNIIEVQYRFGANLAYETKQFSINIEDTRADFEIHVEDYDQATKILTFEILNIAESDVEALTIEILKQDSILVYGSNRNIVGDLDSNDYTTVDFKAIISGDVIVLNVYYSDEINERRMIMKEVSYEADYFNFIEETDPPYMTYALVIGIVLLIIYWVYRRKQKKKALEQKLRNRK